MAVGFQSRSGPQQDHHLTLYAGKRTDNGREVMNSMKVNLTAWWTDWTKGQDTEWREPFANLTCRFVFPKPASPATNRQAICRPSSENDSESNDRLWYNHRYQRVIGYIWLFFSVQFSNSQPVEKYFSTCWEIFPNRLKNISQQVGNWKTALKRRAWCTQWLFDIYGYTIIGH